MMCWDSIFVTSCESQDFSDSDHWLWLFLCRDWYKAAKPFAYRGKWRIQVTLKNGKRPVENFIKHADALQWAADTLANDNSAHEAQLGGPTQATLA